MNWLDYLLAKKGGGGNGAGGVTSWNDLQDKPFGESGTVYMDATASGHTRYSMGFESMHNNLTGQDDTYAQDFLAQPPFTNAGTEIVVTFDGKEYAVSGVVAERYDMTYVYYGNAALDNMSGLPASDYPFCLVAVNATPEVRFADISEHHIMVEIRVVHPIDPKYLPDTAATKADLEAAIGTAIGGSY